MLAGEITTEAHVDYEQIARDAIDEIGYTDAAIGFDADALRVMSAIHKQSADIALGVDRGRGSHTRAAPATRA